MESLKLYDTISFLQKKAGLTQEELAKKIRRDQSIGIQMGVGAVLPGYRFIADACRYF